MFVEFADGLGSFFPANFLQLHRQSNPNQLFVAEAERATARPAIFALPSPHPREIQASHASALLT